MFSYIQSQARLTRSARVVQYVGKEKIQNTYICTVKFIFIVTVEKLRSPFQLQLQLFSIFQ